MVIPRGDWFPLLILVSPLVIGLIMCVLWRLFRANH